MNLSDPGPNPVILSLEGVESQRRATVAFRLVLAIPHFGYASLVGIAASFAVLAGWFAALFTARLPEGIATFLGRTLQYWTRLQGYSFMFLTDRYPPFRLDAAHYPVALEWNPGRLNRAAVFLRLVLMIPAYFVTWILGSGAFVVSFFVWLIVLITGRLPDALFQANAAILRYQARFYGYSMMLTSEYPRGLFGDRVETSAPLSAPPVPSVALPSEPVAAGAPIPPAPTPTPSPTPTPTPQGDEGATPPPSPPGPPPPTGPTGPRGLPLGGDGSVAHPRITRLVLSRAAKRIVVLVLVLGAVVGIGTTVVGAVGSYRGNQVLADLQTNHAEVVAASEQYFFDTQNCALSQGGVACLGQASDRLAVAFEGFNEYLRDESFPAYSVDVAQRTEAAGVRVVETLRSLAGASTPAQFQVRAFDFQDAAVAFDQAITDLALTLP